MLITTETPDADGGATVFARIPEPIDERARITRYDLPLGSKLADLGIEHSLRGFCLPRTPAHPPGVGIEVRVRNLNLCGFVVECLAELGAPAETLIELETDKALTEMSLSELMDE